MQDLVDKFSNPGELLVDLFPGTFAAAKVCLEALRHCRFVGCESYSECF